MNPSRWCWNGLPYPTVTLLWLILGGGQFHCSDRNTFRLWELYSKLGGGCEYFLCSPLFGEDEPILTNIFQMGWNHQLDSKFEQFAQMTLKNSWIIFVDLSSDGGGTAWREWKERSVATTYKALIGCNHVLFPLNFAHPKNTCCAGVFKKESSISGTPTMKDISGNVSCR